MPFIKRLNATNYKLLVWRLNEFYAAKFGLKKASFVGTLKLKDEND